MPTWPTSWSVRPKALTRATPKCYSNIEIDQRPSFNRHRLWGQQPRAYDRGKICICSSLCLLPSLYLVNTFSLSNFGHCQLLSLLFSLSCIRLSSSYYSLNLLCSLLGNSPAIIGCSSSSNLKIGNLTRLEATKKDDGNSHNHSEPPLFAPSFVLPPDEIE